MHHVKQMNINHIIAACCSSYISGFPNCGMCTTSGMWRPSRWQANKPTTFCLSPQKYIHSYGFYLSDSVNYFPNFCVLLLLCFNNGHYNFSQPLSSCHMCPFWFSKLLIEWYLVDWVFLEQGGTWWQYGSHKWYVLRKSLRTTVIYESWFKITLGN